MSALVFGCFGPDLEYFLWLRPHGHFGHTLPGLFLFDLPACLIALFFFQRYAKAPLVACLPMHLRERIHKDGGLEIRTFSKFMLVCASIMVGVLTHVVWDSFTHDSYLFGRDLEFLKKNVDLPVVGLRDWALILQYASSVFGLVAILVWFIYWYRHTAPDHLEKESGFFSRDRLVVAGAFVAAILVGLVRAAIGGLPNGIHGYQRFMTVASISSIATFCLEILAYGAVHNRLGEKT